MGSGACAGIARGALYIIDRSRVSVPRFRVGREHRANEVERFERAVSVSEMQLRNLHDRARDQGLDQVAALLKAHAMILRDAAFFDATRSRIMQEGQNAEWSLHATVREVRRLFDHLEQDFFRQRRSDVDIVGDRVLRNLLGSAPDPLAEIPERAVIAARDLSPADTLALARERVQAFITVSGGRTSHTAILARALGVPCVVGIPELLHEVTGGEDVLVDGVSGRVVINPSGADISRYEALARRRSEEEQALLADRDVPAITRDGVHVHLMGNIEVRHEVQAVLRVGGQGIGLYRTEFLGFDGVAFDDVEAQTHAYAEVVELMDGRPVTIRSLDIGGDKNFGESDGDGDWATSDFPVAADDSPLGLRAIRKSLLDREGFRLQLEAICRASGRGPVRLLIPFVTEAEEVKTVREELRRTQDVLRHRNEPFDETMPLGIMLETPASIFCLEELSRLVDFFSVGTNDLIQFVMAADRSIEAVAHLCRPSHPAVLRVLDKIRKEAGRPVAICGEVAADPFMAPLLVGLGFSDLSMSPLSIPVVKRMIRRLNAEACHTLAERALRSDGPDQVEQLVTEALRTWTPDLLGLSDGPMGGIGR